MFSILLSAKAASDPALPSPGPEVLQQGVWGAPVAGQPSSSKVTYTTKKNDHVRLVSVGSGSQTDEPSLMLTTTQLSFLV